MTVLDSSALVELLLGTALGGGSRIASAIPPWPSMFHILPTSK